MKGWQTGFPIENGRDRLRLDDEIIIKRGRSSSAEMSNKARETEAVGELFASRRERDQSELGSHPGSISRSVVL